MKAMKITFQGVYRIRVDFIYDPLKVQQLKTIPDATWSNTLKTWHIPYTKEAFKLLRNLFPDLEIVLEAAPKQQEKETTVTNDPGKLVLKLPSENTSQPKIPETGKAEIEILVSGRQISVKMPKNDTDVQFIRSFRYYRWNKSAFCWIIPHYKDNLEKLKAYFGTRKVSINDSNTTIGDAIGDFELPVVQSKEMLVKNYSFKTLRLYTNYNIVLENQLKKIPYSRWNTEKRCREVPYSENFLKEIKKIAEQNGFRIKYQVEDRPVIQPRKSKHDIANYRKCPQEFIDKLVELRYSKHTLDSYTDLFEEFINYYEDIEIEDISDEQITRFILYLVNTRKVSTSYQNQSINAIKFYYERVKRGMRKIYMIDRPREEKTLPEVLSEEEVASIIRLTENLKHKAILMTIYSGGLRISELINLKIKDIDSNRMQIRIEQAKGKKDRYTLLSKTTLEILRKYVKEFKPKVYLFEGSDGVQYSTSSIYQMFRASTKKAGILKQVSIHTLRHSFATHLLESGVSTRYIQNLLGHESSKTTEIYTHITTRGINQIINPLDKLKII